MSRQESLQLHLTRQGISRRSFLKFCSMVASLLALPQSVVAELSGKLGRVSRPSVIWLSFQECTGCTESFTRAHAPSIEELIFNFVSLDYHHTLQAASGEAAELARAQAMRNFYGKYLLIVDGSIPVADGGVYSTIAGKTNLELLQECVNGAAAVIAIGTCATFGGLPAANPNPTGATGVADLMQQGRVASKPLVNIPGCPPLPLAISGVLVHYLAFERFPALDEQHRPLSFYGETVHERCSRYHFYQEEKFAESFDDEAARKGWCLYKLGCKGPVTHNACATLKWNNGTSFPIQSGHTCIGCSEPGFWDRGGFYRSLDETALAYQTSAGSVGSGVSEGRDIYESNCVYCHSPDPAEFSTAPDKIADVLRSGEVRSHRRLDFSDEQLRSLQDYLKSIK
ncbi:MAG: hydrogenase small subunit [Chromatiales bacterium]|jgi:hydrogenase small subunit